MPASGYVLACQPASQSLWLSHSVSFHSHCPTLACSHVQVPSAKFLDDMNSMKLRQESIDFGEIQRGCSRSRRTP
jgi:hypothetical protein